MWTQYVSEATGLAAVYSGTVPALERLNLHEVCLQRDGPSVLLRFDLNKFPVSPPKKWVSQGFNTVQISLRLLGVEDIRLSGWSSNCFIDINLTKIDGRIRLNTSNGPLLMEVTADLVLLNSISAYCDGV